MPTDNNINCAPFRLSIPDLAYRVNNMTGLEPEKINKILSGYNNQPYRIKPSEYEKLGVNHKEDVRKLSPKEREAGFKAETSVSQAEAYRFIYQVIRFGNYNAQNDIIAAVARSLKEIYFPGQPLFEDKKEGTKSGTPPHNFVKMKIYGECYDSDTCRVSINVPYKCYERGYAGYYGPMREAQVDSPEIGNLKYGIVSDEALAWVVARFKGSESGMTKPRGTKPKLIDNAIKVFKEMTQEKGFTKEDFFVSVQLIATWMSFSSEIDKAIMNDFVKYVEEKGGKFATKESTLRYTSEDTPAHMCGLWTPYDVYLRRLGSIYVDKPELILGYIAEGLPKTVRKLTREKYPPYKILIAKYAIQLKASSNPKIQLVADLLAPNKLITPSTIYDAEKRRGVLHKIVTFRQKFPNFQTSWSLTKVLLGLEYDYKKYRGQDNAVFDAAGQLARRYHHGSWKYNPTFSALYEYNKKDSRYHPKDCLTGKK